MKKTNLIVKSNAEINSLVVEYQSNPNDTLYMEIHEAVYPMLEAVAYSYYHKSKGLNKTVDEFLQCARIAIFKAIPVYDIEKGADFTSLAKQFTQWVINDELFKKSQNKSNQFNNTALSLDKPLNSTEGTFLDAVEYQIATDIDEVFNAITAKASQDIDSLGAILTGLVNDFAQTTSKDDSTIIKVWVSTILSITDSTADIKKTVNKAIESVMPDVSPATLRKRKSRAEKRFNTFAQEKGFPSFNLSQF